MHNTGWGISWRLVICCSFSSVLKTLFPISRSVNQDEIASDKHLAYHMLVTSNFISRSVNQDEIASDKHMVGQMAVGEINSSRNFIPLTCPIG